MRAAPVPAATRALLMVDDHMVVREGIKRLLEPLGDAWAVTEAGTGEQALERLRRQRFDLAIVDLSLPGMTGLELVQRMRTSHPDMPVLVLSMHAEEEYALRAYKAGAAGYLTKDAAATELIGALQKVAGGGVFVSVALAEHVVLRMGGRAAGPRHATLTDRELEVLRRIVAGQRMTDIGRSLHLSVKTVSTHKRRILDKLKLPNDAALIRYGLEHGLHGQPLEPGAADGR